MHARRGRMMGEGMGTQTRRASINERVMTEATTVESHDNANECVLMWLCTDNIPLFFWEPPLHTGLELKKITLLFLFSTLFVFHVPTQRINGRGDPTGVYGRGEERCV